jgi:hypothetical protein
MSAVIRVSAAVATWSRRAAGAAAVPQARSFSAAPAAPAESLRAADGEHKVRRLSFLLHRPSVFPAVFDAPHCAALGPARAATHTS